MRRLLPFLAFNESIEELASDKSKEFLDHVQKNDPHLIREVRNKIANRGLSAAKKWYNSQFVKKQFYDTSETLAQKVEKIKISKENAKNRKQKVLSLIPDWKTITNLIKQNILTPDIKNIFYNHYMPQLVLNQPDLRKIQILGDSYSLNFRLKSEKYFHLSDFQLTNTSTSDVDDYKNTCAAIVQFIKNRNGVISSTNPNQISLEERSALNSKKTRKMFHRAGISDEEIEYYSKNKEIKTINVFSLSLRGGFSQRANTYENKLFIACDTFIDYNITSVRYKKSEISVTLHSDPNTEDILAKTVEFLDTNLKSFHDQIIKDFKIDISQDVTFNKAEDFFS